MMESLTSLFDPIINEPEPVTDVVTAARDRLNEAAYFHEHSRDLALIAALVTLIETTMVRSPVVDMDAHGRVGASHPETSKRAASRPRFGTQRWQVLQIVADAGTEGVTAAAIAELVGKSRNQVATRLLELREAQLVAWKRDERFELVERDTGTGCTGLVHVVTSYGRQLLEDHDQ